MDFFRILSEIEKVDPEVYERFDARRKVFKHMAGVGKKLSAAALPLAVGAFFNKAYGQNRIQEIGPILNFALRLEYLEMYFYQQGQASQALQAGLSATNRAALNLIATDERNHVSFLRSVIPTTTTTVNMTPTASVAATDPGASFFDFRGPGGVFSDVFTNPATYLAVAQALEDTGVRAYKGAAPSLSANKTVLEAALNIHSVEARHASRLRTMRRGGPANDRASMSPAGADPKTQPKSWISGTDQGGPVPAVTAAIYGAGVQQNYTTAPFPAEDNTVHARVKVTTNTPTSPLNIPASAYSEAFDEPLNFANVAAIAGAFTPSDPNYFRQGIVFQ